MYERRTVSRWIGPSAVRSGPGPRGRGQCILHFGPSTGPEPKRKLRSFDPVQPSLARVTPAPSSCSTISISHFRHEIIIIRISLYYMKMSSNTVASTAGNMFLSLLGNSREQHDEQAVSDAARHAVLIPDDTALKVRCLTTLRISYCGSSSAPF